jgi:Tfp pilus assembly protein PilF
VRRAIKLFGILGALAGVAGVALRLLNGPRKASESDTVAQRAPAHDGIVIGEGVSTAGGHQLQEPIIGAESMPVREAAQHEPVIGSAQPENQPTTAQSSPTAAPGVADVVSEIPPSPLITAKRGQPPAAKTDVVSEIPPPPPSIGVETEPAASAGLARRESGQQPGDPSAPAIGEKSGAHRVAESYLDEGNVYFNVGQYSLAIERYTRAIEEAPALVAAYYNRANAHTRAGHYDEALADYNHALELEPNDGDALNNRGMLHLYREEYERAVKDFDASLAVSPLDATVAVNRGLARLHTGDATAALADFEHASSLDPEDGAAAYGSAQASATLGNREDALRHVARAIELDGHYAREAAADSRLQLLQGDEAFMKLLRGSNKR